MNDTKADSSNDAAVQTLLHYLVRVVIKAAPVLLDFMNELPHLHAAAKCKTSPRKTAEVIVVGNGSML